MDVAAGAYVGVHDSVLAIVSAGTLPDGRDGGRSPRHTGRYAGKSRLSVLPVSADINFPVSIILYCGTG